ncbi:hypothetical protein NE897_03090 [Yersinia ruckeri]|uniref:Uncharacterized protein n=1 Tax=Yersinia ruckeri TaxID=29486 RepID=A0A2Z2K7T4_YERRU|nr:hypothetical protein [Yersinia ruckeri]AKA37719.1 hypothetical protein UGYR_04455 [Yersinia ruckeri]ARZ01766.1 hypothetical protein QMA0440_02444 [Yersinia ruckeri]ARZ01834.1 hypothetical protein QMA0440_02512 [Yersinia ruckeri]EKN4198487.1 hypothetical protein [Yersinia ruckeri]EKN4687695.1 hypothetical protein [Yersinia ruckeri]
MSNIDKFNEFAGRVFGILYEEFPIPTNINVGDILGDPDLYNTTGIPPEMADDADIAGYTVVWLRQSGYLDMLNQDISLNEFYNVVLTAKGLEVLKAIPDSLTPRSSPLGTQIADAVKSGAKETVSSLVNQALSTGIKLAASSVGIDI